MRFRREGRYDAPDVDSWTLPLDPAVAIVTLTITEAGYRRNDLGRLDRYIEDACARVPILAEGGVKRVVNGPIPYAPDGNPYIGPAHGLTNFYQCCCFSFGIAQSGGAGKFLSEWVVDGAPEWDGWVFDPRRYTGYATTAPQARYRIRFTTTGVYQVWVRGYAAGTNDNSLHVGLDGARESIDAVPQVDQAQDVAGSDPRAGGVDHAGAGLLGHAVVEGDAGEVHQLVAQHGGHDLAAQTMTTDLARGKVRRVDIDVGHAVEQILFVGVGKGPRANLEISGGKRVLDPRVGTDARVSVDVCHGFGRREPGVRDVVIHRVGDVVEPEEPKAAGVRTVGRDFLGGVEGGDVRHDLPSELSGRKERGRDVDVHLAREHHVFLRL